MDENIPPISDVLINIPGAFGDALRDAAKREAEFVAEHGQDAWDKRIEESRRREIAERDRKRAEELSRMRIEKSGLVDSLDAMTFGTFIAKEEWQCRVLDLCKRFIGQTDARWLYISGTPGCGKTHLGTAVSGHYLRAGRPTRYATYQQIMVAFRAHANDDNGYFSVLREYGHCPVLYVDDLMKFDPTPGDRKSTFELLNTRLSRRGITIITSEKSLSDIMDIDEAMGSRIKQMCGIFTMHIASKDGRNYRMRKPDI